MYDHILSLEPEQVIEYYDAECIEDAYENTGEGWLWHCLQRRIEMEKEMKAKK